MGYKLLGFVVWRGARWYLGHRLPGHGPARKLVVAGCLAAAAVLVLAGAKKNQPSGQLRS